MATLSQNTEPVSILKNSPHAQVQPSDHCHTSPPDRTVQIVTSDDEEDDIVPDMNVRYLSDGEDEDQGVQHVSAEALELLQTEKVVKSGYLFKKGEKRRTWKKRWFVLRTTKMAMYKDIKEYKLLRIIDLSEIHSVAHDTSKDKYKCVFAISTPKRAYFVKAGNKEEMDDWMRAIEEAKANLRLNESDDDASFKGRDQAVAQDANCHVKSLHRRRSSGGGHETQPVSTSKAHPPSGSSLLERRPSGINGHAHVRPVDIPKARALQPEWSNHSSSLHTTGTSPDQGLSSSATGHVFPLSPLSDPHAQQHLSENLASSEDDEEYSCHEDSHVPSDHNKVIMSGYLLKLGRLQGWKKRWYVLTADSLACYSSDKERVPHRSIPLTHIIDSLEIEPVTKNKRYCFKIVIHKRNYVLCASSEQELESWLNALSVSVRRAKNKEAGTVHGNHTSPPKVSSMSPPQSKRPDIQKTITESSLDSFEIGSHLSGVSGAGGVGGAGGALPGRAK